MYLSVISPIYNEYENIPLLYNAVVKALAGIEDWELVLVDDGSGDRSFETLAALADRDPDHVRVIQLRVSLCRRGAKGRGLRGGHQCLPRRLRLLGVHQVADRKSVV